MTFVQAAILVPCVVCAVSVLWLRALAPQNVAQERKYEVGGVDNIDELRWSGWSLSKGWAPVMCWRGCSELHRDDWWRTYLSRTCWPGCAELHREDWWRAYVDQAAQESREPAHETREQTFVTSSPNLRPDRLRVGIANRGTVHQA